MLDGADLQELRGTALDRLLLRVWPKFDQHQQARCVSCSTMETDKRGFVVVGHGLCVRCYSRWRNGNPNVTPGPAKLDSYRECRDVLLAGRIGVHRSTLKLWRNGTSVPMLQTLHRIMPGLEAAFGVPADTWLEALAISNAARGWVLSLSGRKYVPGTICKRVNPISERPEIGRQFGYWLAIDAVRWQDRGQRGALLLLLRVRCLLCGSAYEVQSANLKTGQSTKCQQCSRRLNGLGRTVSGFKGVHCRSKTGRGGRWIVEKTITGFPYKSFDDPAAAARYYDACMYARYGHTLFLNFPDEYDRSKDPAFAAVGH